MNPLANLEQLNLEPTAKTEVAAMLQALMNQTTADAKLIQAKDVKIEALTYELAYYKRIRFSTKSEALAPLQRDVFEETWNTDTSAIEAEVEQLQGDQTSETGTKPFKRPRAGRQPLPDHLPRIEHRHEPESCACGKCGKDLVKIGEDVSEQLDVEPAKFFVHRHLCPVGTFARSMPAVPAKPLQPRRFRRR